MNLQAMKEKYGKRGIMELHQNMKKYWIKIHAKSIAEVTQNPLFSYERLAQAFKRLDNNKRDRRRRRKLKRKRKDRGDTDEQTERERDNEESKRSADE